VIGVAADTNIYISALIFAGLPRQFLLAAEDARIHLFISEPIRLELRRILQTKFSWSNAQVSEAMLQLERRQSSARMRGGGGRSLHHIWRQRSVASRPIPQHSNREGSRFMKLITPP
jgi:hypothetical protein